MGNRARDLLNQDKTVLFAFEEAIGVNTHTFIHGNTQIAVVQGHSLRNFILIICSWHHITRV